MNKAYLRDVAYVLPEAILDNDALAQVYTDWTAEKILRKTGIEQRHITGEGETALDLAQRACEKLFQESALQRTDVDYLILITESPDYILPPSSCILQNRLGLPKTCAAFDMNLGCSAYVYGLTVAKGLIAGGLAQNILLVTAETYSKHIHPKDKSTRTLFGDAAAATWVSSEGTIELCQEDLGTDGSGADKLIIPAGMMRTPSNQQTAIEETDENGYTRTRQNLFMDGTAIFNFTIEVVPETVDHVLRKQGIDKQEISLFILHQANEFMLTYLRKKLRIPQERFYLNMRDTGNTVSCSVPIALKRAMNEGVFPKSGYAMLVGFGVGLSWGSMILHIGGAEE